MSSSNTALEPPTEVFMWQPSSWSPPNGLKFSTLFGLLTCTLRDFASFQIKGQMMPACWHNVLYGMDLKYRGNFQMIPSSSC
jgi:hypothetical protein